MNFKLFIALIVCYSNLSAQNTAIQIGNFNRQYNTFNINTEKDSVWCVFDTLNGTAGLVVSPEYGVWNQPYLIWTVEDSVKLDILLVGKFIPFNRNGFGSQINKGEIKFTFDNVNYQGFFENCTNPVCTKQTPYFIIKFDPDKLYFFGDYTNKKRQYVYFNGLITHYEINVN